MKSTIAITKQWQLHIPKSMREALGLKVPTTVNIEAKAGKIIVTPHTSSVLKEAGKYAKYARGKGKKINLANIRDHIDYSNL